MQISVCLQRIIIGMAPMLFWFVSTAHADVASVYGGPDGYCGSRTANGERVDCSAMTAAHRRLPFGTQVRVCHTRCVTVRINDRGPWVRGRDIDLTPARPELLDWMEPGTSTLRDYEGHRTRSKQTCASYSRKFILKIPQPYLALKN